MDIRPGDVFAGYIIERLIATGQMGSVYRAQHPHLPKRQALRVLPSYLCQDPAFVAQFERGADAASAMNHPHILSVDDRGTFHGQPWVSMPYVEGRDLAAVISSSRHGLLPALAVHIIGQVGSALDYAHRRHLLHRDINLSGILLSAPPNIDDQSWTFISGFGKFITIDGQDSSTRLSELATTLPYASPEQVYGEPLDHRSNIYSLGCVLHALLTGTTPPWRSLLSANSALHSQPPRPSAIRGDLPRAFDQVIAIATATHADDRYQDCRGMANDAQRALNDRR